MVYLNLLGPTCWKGLDEEVDVGKVAKDWFASSVGDDAGTTLLTMEAPILRRKHREA